MATGHVCVTLCCMICVGQGWLTACPIPLASPNLKGRKLILLLTMLEWVTQMEGEGKQGKMVGGLGLLVIRSGSVLSNY